MILQSLILLNVVFEVRAIPSQWGRPNHYIYTDVSNGLSQNQTPIAHSWNDAYNQCLKDRLQLAVASSSQDFHRAFIFTDSDNMNAFQALEDTFRNHRNISSKF